LSLRHAIWLGFGSSHGLTRVLLLFWAIWFSVVFASNAADALREVGLLPPSWRFASGNLALVAESASVYSLSQTWTTAGFSLVLALQLSAASLFWRAVLEPKPLGPQARSRVLRPFLAGIALFCGFLVSDEVLLVYRRFPNLETTHFGILCALLLSLVLIHVLGGRDPAA
jgi:hypothetical protein